MFKKVLGSLVVLSLVIAGGTVLQAMGDEHVKREDKTKDVKVVKNKERSSSQKSIQYSRSAPKKVAKLKEIENWEIYTSDIGSYEIKYPSNWKLEKSSDEFLKERKEEFVGIGRFPSNHSSSIDKELLKSKEEFAAIRIFYSKEISTPYYMPKIRLEEKKTKSPEKFSSLKLGILDTFMSYYLYETNKDEKK